VPLIMLVFILNSIPLNVPILSNVFNDPKSVSKVHPDSIWAIPLSNTKVPSVWSGLSVDIWENIVKLNIKVIVLRQNFKFTMLY